MDENQLLTESGVQRRLSERLAPADGIDLDDIEFERVSDCGRPVVELGHLPDCHGGNGK